MICPRSISAVRNDFIIHVGAREKIAKRINDTAATACDDSVWVLPKIAIVVTRKIPATIELIACEHKATLLLPKQVKRFIERS
jgi:hypothetical protein